MTFKITDQHLFEFHGQGYTILRSILTPQLIRELRPATDAAREIAYRSTVMHQDQVLRPLGDHASELDLTPFRHYVEHPPFVDAIHRIVGPDAELHTEDVGVLFEPRDEPMCTNWHRDISPPEKKWDPFLRQMAMRNASFNSSINCALYADSCIGFVPGSHSRPYTEIEKQVIDAWKDFDAVERDGAPMRMEPADKEMACIETFRAMPNAVTFALEAGDMVVYASNGLHFAHRAPYRKRATLHHNPRVPSRDKWIREHVLREV
ncbi:MAG: hypothetical protein CMJ18_10665 [Phycisphaeraceae bacterium]|nr:hypothetical protein [Phycisphaeraceae bacterium]